MVGKILTLDIETSPNLAYCWGLWEQTIQLNQLEAASEMICWAAKWLDKSEIMFESKFHGSKKKMLNRLHDLLDEADVVIHYNGRSFDIPIINKDFLMNKISPPSPYKQIDLIETAKRTFKFQSNRLEFISSQLGVGSKKKHEGFGLWKKCMEGDTKAWEVMKKYNMNDVRITEKLYKKLLPWIANHPNLSLMDDIKDGCPKCKSTKLMKRGYSTTLKYKWQRIQCRDCGGWFRGERL